MEPIGLWRLSANAWRDGLDVMRRHASLFTLAFIGLLIVYWISLSLSPAPQSMAELHADPQIAARTLPTTLLVAVIDSLLRIGIVTPCALVAHRFVLAGQEGDRTALQRPRIIRFALCLLAITLALLGGSLTIGLAGALVHLVRPAVFAAITLTGLILTIAILIVTVRFALVFPAVAMDRDAPWAASWRLTRSHWWRIVGTFFVCLTLPMLVIGLISLMGNVLPHGGAVAVRAITGGAGGILSATVAATLASWLYRQFGGDTGAPAVIW